jgi:hypothetical protein
MGFGCLLIGTLVVNILGTLVGKYQEQGLAPWWIVL